MLTSHLKELMQQAAEIAGSVPEPLREAAFHRALDVLLGNAGQKTTDGPPPTRLSSSATDHAPQRPFPDRPPRFVTPLPRLRNIERPAPLPAPPVVEETDRGRASGALRKRRSRERLCELLRQLAEDGYFDRPRSSQELLAHVEQLIGPCCKPLLLTKALRQLEREGTLSCAR